MGVGWMSWGRNVVNRIRIYFNFEGISFSITTIYKIWLGPDDNDDDGGGRLTAECEWNSLVIVYVLNVKKCWKDIYNLLLLWTWPSASMRGANERDKRVRKGSSHLISSQIKIDIGAHISIRTSSTTVETNFIKLYKRRDNITFPHPVDVIHRRRCFVTTPPFPFINLDPFFAFYYSIRCPE